MHIHDHNEQDLDDGIDNSEHILDMFSQIDSFFQNIKDNTDSTFELLKMSEKDEDIADVIKIDASEILEIEKVATLSFNEFSKIKDLIIKDGEVSEDKKEIVENYYNTLQKFEKKSSELFFNLIKKLN